MVVARTEAAINGWSASMGARLRVRTTLRRLRERAGLTQEEVATKLDWSVCKVGRFETGTVTVTSRDVQVLLQLYAVTDPRTAELLRRDVSAARRRSWWSAHSKSLGSRRCAFLGFEESAQRMRVFELRFVPGPLQTERYARDASRVGLVLGIDDCALGEEVQRHRRRLVDAADERTFEFVIAESVLHQTFDGMAEQCAHLLDLMARPTVDIRVVPHVVGAYPALGSGGNVTLLDIFGVDETLVSEHGLFGPTVVTEPSRTQRMEQVFADTLRLAANKHESTDIIRNAIAIAATKSDRKDP